MGKSPRQARTGGPGWEFASFRPAAEAPGAIGRTAQSALYQALRAESVNEGQSRLRKPLSGESPGAGIR